jgi:hypothetical protein
MGKALHRSWYLPYRNRNPELDDPKPQGIHLQDQRMNVPPAIKLKKLWKAVKMSHMFQVK